MEYIVQDMDFELEVEELDYDEYDEEYEGEYEEEYGYMFLFDEYCFVSSLLFVGVNWEYMLGYLLVVILLCNECVLSQ